MPLETTATPHEYRPKSDVAEQTVQSVLDDGSLVQRIQRYLYAQGVPELNRIEVEEIGDGVVLLTGQLELPRSKWLCVNCTRRVAGVNQVLDQLVVTGS